MPELPEVTTTVRGLQNALPGMVITDAWTDLAVKGQKYKQYENTIKNKTFFDKFKKIIFSKKVLSVERRAKHILIHLAGNETILIHLKMTGHLMIGNYQYDAKKNKWFPHKDEKNTALSDPYNRFIHVVFTIKKGNSAEKHLVFCDSRKFGTVSLLSSKNLEHLGPEPLDDKFTFTEFAKRLEKKPRGKIKTVLMDQSVISGIGNIYSDEMLWLAGIHPEQSVATIPKDKIKLLYAAMKKVLLLGIQFGGDSTSDYRDIEGKPGRFHHKHNVYQKTGEKCAKPGCKGIIIRKVVGSRSAHFCNVHQKLI